MSVCKKLSAIFLVSFIGVFAYSEGKILFTGTDNDGWAYVRTVLYRWDDQNRKWGNVNEAYTQDGRCSFQASPGVYRLGLYYNEATSAEWKYIEGIELNDKASVERAMYFEKGQIRFTGTDNDGWAYTRTVLYRWDDQNRKWGNVNEAYTQDGRSAFTVVPGVYRLGLYYQEATSAEWRYIEGIQISDKSAIEKESYFEKGQIRFTGTDGDGWASVRTILYRWDDQNRKWGNVNEAYTSDGRCGYSVVPGLYRLGLYYTEATSAEWRNIDGIQVGDKSAIEKESYFEKGQIRFTGTDGDGWASVRTILYRWDDQNRKWGNVNEAYTSDGRCNYTVVPGAYRLGLYYNEAKNTEWQYIDDIQIYDRLSAAFGRDFGKGNMPPLINVVGPIEIGDGDGEPEIGERILFRIDVSDSDIDSVSFFINDTLIKEQKGSGKFEQIINCNSPGDYRFTVRAYDRNGSLESFGSKVSVSMQKDLVKSGAKSLSPEYGKADSKKVCPTCGKEYPKEAAFCQNDGAKLNLVEKTVQAVLDKTLSASGIDPKSKEAENAKSFGLDWMNPFSTSEKIDQDIQRIVDDILK